MPSFSQSYDIYIHPTADVEYGAKLGAGTKVWRFCHVMPGAVIGKKCNLGQGVFIAEGVILGDGVKVQNNVSIYKGVHCADYVFLGPSVVFTNVRNPRAFISRKSEYVATKIGYGASIGANATIVCGITINEYAMVAAGAVVTKDVPAFALVVGVPARVVGYVSKVGENLIFDEGGIAVCPSTEERYHFVDGDVVHIVV